MISPCWSGVGAIASSDPDGSGNAAVNDDFGRDRFDDQQGGRVEESSVCEKGVIHGSQLSDGGAQDDGEECQLEPEIGKLGKRWRRKSPKPFCGRSGR
jgi:hypothetical protein